MGEQHAGCPGSRQRRRGLAFVQPSIGLRRKVCGCTEVNPVGVERVAGITVTDARRAQDATEPAHDHRNLRRRVARLIVQPDDVSEPFDRHRAALRDAEHPQRQSCLPAPERVFRDPFDRKTADDAHA
jgi:hypothetical protein